MRVVVNLVHIPGYVDRFRMLCHLSTRVDHLTILTDTLPTAFAAEARLFPHLRVVALGRARFRRRAHAWLDARLDGPGLEVVHDTFGHLADWMQARGSDPQRRVRFLTTQYTSNAAWFSDVRHRHPYDWPYASLRVISHWRDRRVCRAVDRVIVLGPGHEASVVEAHGVSPDRVVWLPSEIDTDRFGPAPHPVAEAPLLLFTGAVIRNKGIDLLLEVFARLRAARPTLGLLLVGRTPGPERPWLEAAVADAGLEGVVQYRETVPQDALIGLYRRATVFVLPSLFEGSPRSLREALACGCRAVASDIPGNRGIDPAGDYVRFAPVRDTAAWCAALSAMLDESAEAARARSQRGMHALRRRHSLPAVASSLAALYREVLAEPPNPG